MGVVEPGISDLDKGGHKMFRKSTMREFAQWLQIVMD